MVTVKLSGGEVSAWWALGESGTAMRFAALRGELALDTAFDHMVKVLRGEVKLPDGRVLRPVFGESQATRSVLVAAKQGQGEEAAAIKNNSSESDVAVVCIVRQRVGSAVDGALAKMKQVRPVQRIPLDDDDSKDEDDDDDELEWVRCDTYEWGATAFKGIEFYNLRGFRIELDGDFVCYCQLWTADVGVNCGDHDHSDLVGDDAFCEVHLCLVNGTGRGGMVDASVSPAKYVPLPRGHEHGPFWRTEAAMSTAPSVRDDGSVVYGLHRWEAGKPASATSSHAYDLWVAFEFPPANAS